MAADACAAARGLASGEPERKGGGRSRHGLRWPIANRPPQIGICVRRLPSSSSRSRRFARSRRRTLRQQARGRLAPRWRRWRRRRGRPSTHIFGCGRSLVVLLCSLYMLVCTFQASFRMDRVLMMYKHLITTLTAHSYRRAADRRTSSSTTRHPQPPHALTAETRKQLTQDAAHAAALRHTAHLADITVCWPA